ncbi:MAG TPA: LysE family transporter [Candidatus Saccharimonadales bacterium]|nr:LysE family transporter [Candidatus Saccharimonadales bacterium]
MTQYILFGIGFAFAAAVQPGPLQAFLLSQVAEKGWRRTLPAAFSPLVSDGPIALLVLLVLKRLPESVGGVLQVAGGLLLVYLAAAAARRWWRGRAGEPDARAAAPRTLLQAAAVNILNPNPYLGWSLILGPLVLKAWHEGPPNAVALIVAFYATMVTSLGLTILVLGTTQFLGPRGRRLLVLLSALTLAALGAYQLAAGLRRLPWR